jgi:hypothetical protein
VLSDLRTSSREAGPNPRKLLSSITFLFVMNEAFELVRLQTATFLEGKMLMFMQHA